MDCQGKVLVWYYGGSRILRLSCKATRKGISIVWYVRDLVMDRVLFRVSMGALRWRIRSVVAIA